MKDILKNRNGCKDTDAGIIPQDWEIKPLGSLIKYTKGFAFKSKEFSSGGKRVIRISDTTENTIKTENAIYINDDGNIYEKWKLNVDDLVFSTVGSRPPMYDSMVGKVIRINEKFSGSLLNQNQVIIRGIENNIKNSFIYYQFKSKRYLNYIETIVRGNANQVSITLSDLFSFKVIVPPLSEQEKISDILSTWDQAIEKTIVLIDKLQLRKIGLMQQLLTGKVKLAGFNKEWKEDKLGSYFSERKETGTENQVLLSVGKNGVYPQNNSVKKDTSNSDKSKYKQIYKGDIGYNTMRMWQGRSALSQLDGIISPAYTVLKPKANTDPVYFSYLFKLEEMIHKFYRNSQGMVSDTWMCKFKDLSIIKFYAPSSKEEQTAIANILTNVDLEIEQQKAYLDKLNEQKKGLMQQLLTGKTRVN